MKRFLSIFLAIIISILGLIIYQTGGIGIFIEVMTSGNILKGFLLQILNSWKDVSIVVKILIVPLTVILYGIFYVITIQIADIFSTRDKIVSVEFLRFYCDESHGVPRVIRDLALKYGKYDAHCGVCGSPFYKLEIRQMPASEACELFSTILRNLSLGETDEESKNRLKMIIRELRLILANSLSERNVNYWWKYFLSLKN